jgi:branched-chain amino acid aminotransferase
MSLQIWLDGKLVPREQATINVYDHGVLYGDGVFEGIRIYSGRIFENEAHLRRLYDSAKAIRLEIPYTPQQLTDAMLQTASANKFEDCYIRLVVTRGPGDLGIDPRKSSRPVTYIITDKIAIYPKEMYEKGIAVVTSSWVRNSSNATPPRVKSLNYLNNVLAKIEGTDAGVQDAMMLNSSGLVCELTAANLFFVKSGQVATPRVTDGILEGVTRRVMLELCAQANIPCTERGIDRFDVYTADEMFATGTGVEVMPVTRVDGRTIGSGLAGPLTKRLLDLFHRRVRSG